MTDDRSGARELAVLVIEDDEADSYRAAAILSESDWPVVALTASTLAKGIGVISETRVDVVVLDLGLPDSRGVETFRRLHASAPDVPVVIVTGSETDDLVARAALRDGAQDYLLKDAMTADSLLRAIRFALERRAGTAPPTVLESLRQRERELIWRLAESGTGGVAGEVLGRLPLQKVSEELFDRIMTRCAQAINLSIDQMVFGTTHDITARLRDLATDLADAMAGPRDIVDIYTTALARLDGPGTVSKERQVAHEDVGRAVAFELMGYLVSAYRARVGTDRAPR